MAYRLAFAPLLEQNDCHFAQSKGFPSSRPVSTRVMISCNTCSNGERINWGRSALRRRQLGCLQTTRNFGFSPRCFADFAAFEREVASMKTMFVILVLALIAITFEIYSDTSLTSAESNTSAPDPASVAIAHGLKHG
jgi:hypothetical protein